MRVQLASALVGFSALAVGPSPARADVVVQTSIAGFAPFPGAIVVANGVRKEALHARVDDVRSYDESKTAAVASQGVRADATSSQTTTLTTDGDALTLASRASASVTTTVSGDATSDGANTANGRESYELEFTASQRSSFVLSGSLDSDDVFSSASMIFCAGTAACIQITVGSGVDSSGTHASFTRTGIIDAGLSSSLVLQLVGVSGFGRSTGRASWNVTLEVTPAAPTGDDIRWTKRSGGAFTTGANWDPQQVPVKDATHTDNAIFDLRGRYTVDFGSATSGRKALGPPRAADRIEILQGDVVFANADLKVDELDLVRPSLRVDVGKLTLASGQLTSNSATIGDLHSVGAAVVVDGSASRWDCLGRLRVGGSDGTGGDAELTVSGGAAMTSAETRIGAGGAQLGKVTVDGAGSTWATGNAAIGYSSTALVAFTNGAHVTSGLVHIGLLGGDEDEPTVLVIGTDGAGNPTTWTGGELDLGPSSTRLQVVDGGDVEFDDCRLDRGLIVVSGHGRVGPASSFTCSQLRIGDGEFLVRAGGQATSVSGDTTVGLGAFRGTGTLTVDGKDPVTGAPSLFGCGFDLDVGVSQDGLAGVGMVQVTNGATLEILGDAHVASGPGSVASVLVAGGSKWNVVGDATLGDGGTAVVVLDASTISVTGDVAVASTGTLLGNGTVDVGGALHVDGFVGPGIDFEPAVAPFTPRRAVAPRKKPAPPPTGTLTIQGNLVVGPTGVVTAEAAGARSDQLVVTGDATLGGTLVLQFKNGFAPKTGDRFDVFRANGATTGAFASVETRGLAPGAQFDVATSGGAITATATNDAVALPTVSVKASTKKLLEKKSKRKKGAFTFTRKGAATAALTVSYSVRGTATNGIDYVSIPGTVTIPAKKRSAKVVVQLVNDSMLEGAETIDVAVLPGADFTQSLKSRARITIVDDPPSR